MYLSQSQTRNTWLSNGSYPFVEVDVFAEVEVFPGVEVLLADFLGDLLALDEEALRDAGVLDAWLCSIGESHTSLTWMVPSER